jgi:acetylornithine/LysW-gamma-L-lysine aminotransferase
MTDFKALEHEYGVPLQPKRDLVAVSGSGACLYDEAGEEYIDCVGGIGVASLGHSHPAIVAAIKQQAETLITCPNIMYNDVRSNLLKRLVEVTPQSLTRAYLCNSGAEAIEAALKFARLHTGRTNFVTAMRGFHGRTMGAVSATYTPKYREAFQPLIPGFDYVPFNKIEKLDAAVTDNTAAVLFELVQGEGGVNPVQGEYLAAARKLCSERGVLLIIDEIQTGFCRTGKFFACDHFDLQPDMMCVAKAMGGGVPIGATLLSADIQIATGLHGTTFGGNPLACAAALAAIDVYQSDKLAQRAAELGGACRAPTRPDDRHRAKTEGTG